MTARTLAAVIFVPIGPQTASDSVSHFVLTNYAKENSREISRWGGVHGECLYVEAFLDAERIGQTRRWLGPSVGADGIVEFAACSSSHV